MSQQHTIGTHKTTVRPLTGGVSVIYHQTEVVRANSKNIILNTGGWFTNTTKTRMNQTSNQFNLGFKIYQKNFDWFVDYKNKTYAMKHNRLVLERG